MSFVSILSDQSFLYLNVLCEGNHRYLMTIQLDECGTEIKKTIEGSISLTLAMQAGQNQSPSGIVVILGLWQYV